MKKFMLGLAVGLALGAGSMAVAQVEGDPTWLGMWSVKVNGETVCRNPWMWRSIQQIKCTA